VTVEAPTEKGTTTGCPGVTGEARSFVGIVPEDALAFTFPGTIAISTPDIGGPSAGLAMTLALIDRLAKGSLTNHIPIAATGTIDQYGDVGDVGGVAEKTIAVEDAGARVFIVPESEVTVAKNASDGHLTVIGVTTLHQALSALEGLGGSPPVPLTSPYPLKSAT
jgi:Lon-like protease